MGVGAGEYDALIRSEYAWLCDKLGLTPVAVVLEHYVDVGKDPRYGGDPRQIVIPYSDGDLDAVDDATVTPPAGPPSWSGKDREGYLFWEEWRSTLWHEVSHQVEDQRGFGWNPHVDGGHGLSWDKALDWMAAAVGCSSGAVLKKLIPTSDFSRPLPRRVPRPPPSAAPLTITVDSLPLQKLWHFTSADAACSALKRGLEPRKTPGDPLGAQGVWLSPNVFGHGSPGSFFGAVGLGLNDAFVARFRTVYIGPNPTYPSRHRFVLTEPASALPDDVSAQEAPSEEVLLRGSTEYLLLAAVPAEHIDSASFVDQAERADDHNEREHRHFMAYLIGNRHRLLKTIPHAHSTGQAPNGGWWVFQGLRDWAVDQSKGAEQPADIAEMLRALATSGEASASRSLAGLEPSAVWQAMTEAYATGFEEASGQPLNRDRDDKYRPPE